MHRVIVCAAMVLGSLVVAPVATADDHTGQHLECWNVVDGNGNADRYCDWYWDD